MLSCLLPSLLLLASGLLAGLLGFELLDGWLQLGYLQTAPLGKQNRPSPKRDQPLHTTKFRPESRSAALKYRMLNSLPTWTCPRLGPQAMKAK